MIRDPDHPPLTRKQWFAASLGFAAFAGLIAAGFLWGPLAAGLGFVILVVLGVALAHREADALRPPD